MKYQFAILASALSEDPRSAVPMSRSLGFDGLLFDAKSAALDIPALSASGRRDFGHVLASHNRRMAGLRCDTGKKGLGPGADIDRVLHQLDRAMEAAASLGAPLVCIDLGPLPAPPRQKKDRPKITTDMAGGIIVPATLTAVPAPESTNLNEIPPAVDPVFVSEVDGALAELGQFAERYSVQLAFRSELSSLAALQWAIGRARSCPWFGIDYCPVSVLRDEWDQDETLGRVGGLVRHVRGCDALGGADHRTKAAPVGQGDTDWEELLAALDSANYHGWITLDPMELPDRPAAAVAGLKHLKKITRTHQEI